MQVEEQSFISILFFLTFGLKPKRCKKCINETVFSSGTSCKDTNSRFDFLIKHKTWISIHA